MDAFGRFWLWFMVLVGVSIADENGERSRLLLISFDGFRWDYLDMYKEETKNIQKLASLGVRSKWTRDQFITKTFPNHWTIATGLYEESHGIVNNHFWDPKLNDEFQYSTDNKFWLSGEPIWKTYEKNVPGMEAATYFWPGSEVEKFQATHFKAPYDALVPFKKRADQVIKWLRNPKIGMMTLYVNEPDHQGHAHGPNSEEVREAIRRCDNLLAWILEEVHGHNEKYENLNIILTSDHGMTQLDNDNKVIYLEDYLKGEDMALLSDHYIDYYTGGHVWCDPTTTCRTLFEKLHNKNPNLNVWLKNSDNPAERIPENLHYTSHYRIPPLLLSAKIGWQVHKTRDFNQIQGQHGYDNNNPDMHPIFVAAGRDIMQQDKKKNFTTPFDSIHLYELFCNILDIPAAPNNGSANKIEYLLKKDGVDWFHLGIIDVTDPWTLQKIMGVVCMISGILVGLFAVFCCEEETPGKAQYLVLEEDEWNNDVDFEDASTESALEKSEAVAHSVFPIDSADMAETTLTGQK